MRTTVQANELKRLAVSAAGVGSLLEVSERHVWSMHSAGRLPLPISLGRSRRWLVSELQDWLAAGCPERREWEWLKEEKSRRSG
jgi:predicted DNA-binding transcriptional regulator AlpA